MNLSEVRKLKTGDKVIYKFYPPKFTKGKEYEVKQTPTGRRILDDRGVWVLLAHTDFLETHFEKV